MSFDFNLIVAKNIMRNFILKNAFKDHPITKIDNCFISNSRSI